MATHPGARHTPTSPHPVTSGTPLVLSGATVVLPTGTVPDGRVVVEDTRIAAAAPEHAQVVDLSGHWVVPGFVDLHNHGGGGASFTSGTVEDVLKGIRTHRLHGTTTLVASTVTGDMDFLTQRAGLLSELAEQGDIAGVHFEDRSSRPAARARTPRSCCATPIRPRCASWSTRRAGTRRWSPSPPSFPAASTPCDCSPSTG